MPKKVKFVSGHFLRPYDGDEYENIKRSRFKVWGIRILAALGAAFNTLAITERVTASFKYFTVFKLFDTIGFVISLLCCILIIIIYRGALK